MSAGRHSLLNDPTDVHKSPLLQSASVWHSPPLQACGTTVLSSSQATSQSMQLWWQGS